MSSTKTDTAAIRTKHIKATVTEAEKNEIEQIAKLVHGKSTSNYVRDVLLEAMKADRRKLARRAQ